MENHLPDSLRERKKENQKKLILRKARKLFLKEGIDSVSVNQIAEAADISYATFFNYFAAKDELFTAIYEEEISDLKCFIEKMSKTTEPTRVSDQILRVAEKWWLDTIPYRVLSLRVTERYIQDAENHTVKSETLAELFEGLLYQGISAGEFKLEPTEVKLESIAIYGLLLGGSVLCTDPAPILNKLAKILEGF